MGHTDKRVCFIIIILILFHLLTGACSLGGWMPMLYLYVMNLISGLLIVGYWLWKQTRITQHIFEMREIAYLFFEILVVALSIYAILGGATNSIVEIAQYVFASLHLMALVIFLIFMLAFRISKLF